VDSSATHPANSAAVLANTARVLVAGVYLCKGLSVCLDVVSSPQDHSNGLRPDVAVVQLLTL